MNNMKCCEDEQIGCVADAGAADEWAAKRRLPEKSSAAEAEENRNGPGSEQ